MKKHLKALLAGAAVAGSILACTAAYARFSDSVTVTNHIAVGDINISLRELEKKDGREMKYQDRRFFREMRYPRSPGSPITQSHAG